MPNGNGFTDYYELLGVPTDAETDVIRSAFIIKAKQYHPDVGGSTELMQNYTRAYRTLMSHHSRKSYDLIHSFQTGKAEYEYREYASTSDRKSNTDYSDKEIDDFLDNIYAEYHYKYKTKQSFFTKIKNSL
jgi:curved DNA-binding protein CbpA